jgi:hypothetical protein
MTFPSTPTITAEMWKTVQNLDVRTVQLSFIGCNPQLRRAFSKVADQILAYSDRETPIFEKTRMWHEDRNNMSLISKINVMGIPTTFCTRSLEKKGSMTLTDIEEELNPLLLQYQMLTYKTLNDFQEPDPPTCSMSWSASTRLTLMALSLGQIAFTFPCDDGFRCIACCQTTLFSALWDPKLQVPKKLSYHFPAKACDQETTYCLRLR